MTPRRFAAATHRDFTSHRDPQRTADYVDFAFSPYHDSALRCDPPPQRAAVHRDISASLCIASRLAAHRGSTSLRVRGHLGPMLED